jgi:hypothetical protein
MSDSLIHHTAPVYTKRADTAIATSAGANGQEDWSGWERWLRGHLDVERQIVIESVAEEINGLEAKRDQQVRELELKLAECIGAVNVLRTGRAMRVRGTYSENAEYKQFDIVAVNGSSFIALEDAPGQCPGKGWQLLASSGKRGERGLTGPRGERGIPGEYTAGFKAFHVDRKTYTLSILTTDGRIHAVPLRGLFEQFVLDSE